jgi:hypothetical protein
MKPLFIMLLTTHKNKLNQENCILTWLDGFEDYAFTTDTSTEVGNQWEVTDDDSYNSNAIKTINTFQKLVKEKYYDKYEWFFYCDDDTCVNVKKILEFIQTADKNVVHSQCAHCWPVDKSLLSISGGGGYLIHKNILKEKGYPELNPIPGSMFGDVQIALWLRENDIDRKHTQFIRGQTPEDCGFDINKKQDRNEMRNYMSFHYIKQKELMETVNDIFNTELE